VSGEPTLTSERSNENRLSAGDHTAKQWHTLLLSLCSTRRKFRKRSAPIFPTLPEAATHPDLVNRDLLEFCRQNKQKVA
jgi:hypothetical protein